MRRPRQTNKEHWFWDAPYDEQTQYCARLSGRRESKYCSAGKPRKGPDAKTIKSLNNPEPVKVSEPTNLEKLEPVIYASIRTQKLVPGAIPTGGTVASFYSHHRISYDVDHLLASMTKEVDEILAAMETQKDWKSDQIKSVLILGKLGGVEVGFRQMFRKKPIKTVTVKTKFGDWVIPTIEEITSFKAVLTVRRNNVRDYLDFAALSETIGDEKKVLDILLSLNDGYDVDYTFEAAKSLLDPRPTDLESTDLKNYKGLDRQWQDWNRVKETCQRYGKLLADEIAKGKKK